MLSKRTGCNRREQRSLIPFLSVAFDEEYCWMAWGRGWVDAGVRIVLDQAQKRGGWLHRVSIVLHMGFIFQGEDQRICRVERDDFFTRFILLWKCRHLLFLGVDVQYYLPQKSSLHRSFPFSLATFILLILVDPGALMINYPVWSCSQNWEKFALKAVNQFQTHWR